MTCEHCGAGAVMGTLYMCGSGRNTDGPFRGEICKELVELRAIVGPLEALLAQEGSHVVLYADVPDVGAPSKITVFSDFTDWASEDYLGDNLPEALDAANTARTASENDGT